MATRNAARPADTSAQITVAGMAADLYGFADERPPARAAARLTFDRRIWQPVLDHLARIDPRQAGTVPGPSGAWRVTRTSYRTRWQHIVGLIHQAVEEAGLDTPVVAGHSMSGGLSQRLRGPAPHAWRHQHRCPAGSRVLHPAAITGGTDPRRRVPGRVGDGVEQSFRTDLLPLPARHLIAHNSRPRQDLVVSYWDELLRQTPDQFDAMLAGSFAAVAASDVPYLLIAGAGLASGISLALNCRAAPAEDGGLGGHRPLSPPRPPPPLRAAAGRDRAVAAPASGPERGPGTAGRRFPDPGRHGLDHGRSLRGRTARRRRRDPGHGQR